MKRRLPTIIEQFEQRAIDAQELSQVEAFLQLAPILPQYVRVRQATIFHKGDLAKHIDTRLSKWSPQLERINGRVPAYRLRMEYGRSDPRKTSGVFVVLPATTSSLYRIVTISYSTFWKKAVRKLIRHLYPGALPVFFKQEEFKSALNSFQINLGEEFRIVLTDMTMKRKVREDTFSPAGHIETDRLWTELGVADAFDQAQEGGYWFTSIKYEVLKRRRRNPDRYSSVSAGRIYKRGESNFDNFYQVFNESAIQKLEDAAAARLEFLSNRGIRERRDEPGKPIQIEYATGLFGDRSEVQRFADAINSYPKSTRAVFHSNPYYRASVADFEDGSSMDIWILSPQRVLISPQAKTSEQALQRLISHIFYNFQEGNITEYVE